MGALAPALITDGTLADKLVSGSFGPGWCKCCVAIGDWSTVVSGVDVNVDRRDAADLRGVNAGRGFQSKDDGVAMKLRCSSPSGVRHILFSFQEIHRYRQRKVDKTL